MPMFVHEAVRGGCRDAWSSVISRSEEGMNVEVSVVVPTRDRPESLVRCLRSILGQRTRRPFEVVVVDDGRECPVWLPLDSRVRLLNGPRRGPGAARNIGIESALGEIVLFTDDDALVDESWLEAAASALAVNPKAVGVEGPVMSPAFDKLYEHSVIRTRSGGFVTCNVGYRRSVLLQERGFDEQFRFPQHEDVDLGARMARRGAILFVAEMRVEHPPRPVGLAELISRGRFVESEWLFHLKYPETRSRWWPVRWGPLFGILLNWKRLVIEERVIASSPARLGRALIIVGGQFAMALFVTLTRWRRFARERGAVTSAGRGTQVATKKS